MNLNLTDKILLSLFSFQPQAAFRILDKLHSKNLFHLAMQLTAGDPTVSGEIVQATWITALENLHVYSSKLAFGNWLFSILVNCSREHHHSTRSYMYLDTNFTEFSRFPKSKSQEVAITFEKALGLLPAGYRHVFILSDVYGYGNKQTAEMLRITDGMCSSHLFRARNALIWLLPQLHPFPTGQFLEWSESQLKIFRAAYTNVAAPDMKGQLLTENYGRNTVSHRQPGWKSNYDFH